MAAIDRTRPRLGRAASAGGLTTLVLLGGCACGALAWLGVRHGHIALIVVMGLIVLFPAALRVAQGAWDPFEPIQVIAASELVLFVARPAAELYWHLDTYGPYLVPPGFTAAMWVCIGGTLALYAGYFTNWGAGLARKVPSLPGQWDRDRSVKFALWTLVVGVFLTAGYVGAIGGLHVFLNSFKGRTGTAGFVLAQQGNAYFAQGQYLVIPVSFMLLAAWQRRHSVFVGLLLLTTIAVALLETVPAGDRTFILQLVMPLVAMPYLRRNRRPRVLGILAVVFVALLAANVLVEVRNIQTRSQHPLIPTITSAITHPGNEIKQFMEGADPSEFTVLEIEVHNLDSRNGFMKFHPGATIGSIIAGPIPRKLIGTKPLSGLEHVTYDLFPATRTARASFGPSYLGDLYDDDGWLTLVIFCAVIGLGARFIFEYYKRNSQSLGAQMVFAAMLPMYIVMVRNSFTDVVARSIFMTFPVIWCMIVCSRPPKRVRRWMKLGWRRNRSPAPPTFSQI